MLKVVTVSIKCSIMRKYVFLALYWGVIEERLVYSWMECGQQVNTLELAPL